MTTTLSDEQEEALRQITAWDRRSDFTLGGFAGTGKTTLIRELCGGYGVTVTAFTGKACHVLRKKGIPAKTLHSLLYHVEQDLKGKPVFYPRDVLADPDTSLFVVDESSMVSKSLYEDLKSFGVPCLFVGDPGQLEPVGDAPYLMGAPDYTLKTIHRQAAENPILRFATHVRMGGSVQAMHSHDERLVLDRIPSINAYAGGVDQVICATNKTRHKLNEGFRKGREGLMTVGEKLICLRNNRWLGVFNGMMFTVVELLGETDEKWYCTVRDEEAERELAIWKLPFMKPGTELAEDVPPETAYCDYGYAITAHKAQGSEWDSVLVVDEPVRMFNMTRWRYTAITRAAQRLVYLC